VLIDPEVTSMTPDWVAELARPVWKDEADLVLPIHPRHRFEGPLLRQLVRPLLGAAYARRLRASIAGAFGCSGRLAARMLAQPMWERDLTRLAFDVSLVATALAEDLRISQIGLGPSLLAPNPARAGLTELFEQAVGTTLNCLEDHASIWTARTEALDLPASGTSGEPAGPEPSVDLAPLAERFRSGVRDLEPLLREILSAETLTRLQAAAAGGEEPPRIPDPLWVTTVYEFAASAHRAVMKREHLTQALVPLYLGRTASFFAELATANEAAHGARLAALEREYEGLRPLLIERWNSENGR
jgi:hypothetical protein